MANALTVAHLLPARRIPLAALDGIALAGLERVRTIHREEARGCCCDSSIIMVKA